MAAARGAGYPPPDTDGSDRPASTPADVSHWAGNLPFADQYSTLQGIMDAAVGAGNSTLYLNYVKNPLPPLAGGLLEPFHVHPTRLRGVVTRSLNITYDAVVPAFITVSAGSLASPATLHANTLSAFPAPEPPGTHLVSGMFEFARLSGGTFVQPFTITLGYDASSDLVAIRRFDENSGTWVEPNGTVSTDTATNTVSVITDEMGTYAVFDVSEIPTISEWGLTALTLLVLTAGTVLIRRRGRTLEG
jgi:hypothetical protein